MAEYNPRNRNTRSVEGPKSTSRWFDDQGEDRRTPTEPCGFRDRENDR